MKAIIGWTVVAGIAWLAIIGLMMYASVDWSNPTRDLTEARVFIENTGRSLGRFISPILQLCLILLILLGIAKHLGLSLPKDLKVNLSDFSSPGNVQATIALIIVGSVCIAALGGLPHVGVLKDLALVVVGFYFGSRRRPPDDTIAILESVDAPAPRRPRSR